MGEVAQLFVSVETRLAGLEKGLGEGVRQAETAGKQIEGSLKGVATQSGRTSETVKKHARETVAENALLTGSFKGMARQAVLAGGATAAAYLGISKAKGAIEFTSELAHETIILHRNLGLTTQTASALGAVLKARGIDVNSAAMGFQTMSRQIVAAESGSKQVQAAFLALGITTRDLKNAHGDLNILLPKIATGFGNIKGGADRAAVSQALLGRGYKSLLPLFAEGADGLNAQLAAAQKYGAVLSGGALRKQEELIQSQRKLKLASMGLKIAFTQAVTPALLEVSDAAAKAGAILHGPGSFEEKLSRISAIIAPAFKSVEDEVKREIPQIANTVGHEAPKVAAAFVSGFEHADVWGKLALGAFLVSKFGGWKAPIVAEGAAGGRAFGLAFATKAQLAVAAGIGGWEIGKWARKHIPVVKEAGDALGGALGSAMSTTGLHALDAYIAAFKARSKAAVSALEKDFNNAVAQANNALDRVTGNTSSKSPAPAVVPQSAFKTASDQRANAATIIAVGHRLGASQKQILAALEAAAVESNFHNLSYGDADSVGVFQQRPSQGWTGLMNVPKAAKEFFQHAMKVAGQGTLTAGQLAQAVQRSAYPGRYDQARTKALGYLGNAGAPSYSSTLDKASNPAKTGSGPAIEKMSLQSALSWLKKHFPGAFPGTFIEDPGTANQHLHISDTNHKDVRSIARALEGMGYSVGEYGGKPIPGVGGITTLKHKHYGAGDHYSGGAIDVNSDGKLLKAFGIAAKRKDYGSNRVRIPSLSQSDLLQLVENQIDHFNLMVQAGLLSAAKAVVKKRGAISAMLPNLTGDTRLKALIELRGLPLPKLLTAAQKTWGSGGGASALWAAFAAKNPGAAVPGSLQGFDQTFASSPWLNAALAHTQAQLAAGQLSQDQANALTRNDISGALPFLSGDDKLNAITAMNGTGPFGGIQKQLSDIGLHQQAGDYGKPGDAASQKAADQASMGVINNALAAGGLNDDEILQLRAALGGLGSDISQLDDTIQNSNELQQQQMDLLQQQLDQTRRELGISQSELRTLSSAVSRTLGQRLGQSRSTPTKAVDW